MGVKSRTFDLPTASSNGDSPAMTSFGGKQYRVRMTEEEKKRVEMMIRNAKSLQEIARLEKELAEGRVPGLR